LGAGVAGGAGETSVGARKTLFLLVIEVGGHVAAGFGGSGAWFASHWAAAAFVFVVALFALALAVAPDRVGFQVARFANSVHGQTVADAGLTFLEVSLQTLALAVDPLTVLHALAEGGVD